ncbi:MAG: sigma factor-like helix-turn-helix DNA-binding protein [Candidatus Pacebacteria bacterium]|nr:sigma factor-like helix-turn-helix DNA-binding protein [Candidatus Paceibacterota bacterium]
MVEIDYQTICKDLLENLPQRQKQVLLRRFGLGQGESETLQRIGNDLEITRERVRQLEKSGFLRLKDFQNDKNLKKIFDYFEEFLNKNGGLKREDILLNELSKKDEKNFIYFLLVLGDNFYRMGDNEILLPFWSNQKEKAGIVEETVKRVKEFFHQEKKPATFDNLSKSLKIEDKNFLSACLEIARDIEAGPLQNYGLSIWPEIKPRGVRDAAYLVLKKAEEPLHFRVIATKAGELSGDLFSKRKMLPQTIHNELIRDKRFILVGRGIYGLSDWGYSTGTVKDVICKVLQANAPMGKEEILTAVQKQRLVKPNTVFLNLSDKTLFSRNQDGKYILKIKTA